MKTFRFYQDIEVTRTYREYYDISAKTLKDARRKAQEVDNLRDCEDAEYYDSEDVLDDVADIENFQNPNIVGIYDSEGEEL